MKKTIFSSPSHEAFVVHRAAETVVVSFAERKEPVPANFSGEAMLARVRIHNQNITTAANAHADKKTLGHLS